MRKHVYVCVYMYICMCECVWGGENANLLHVAGCLKNNEQCLATARYQSESLFLGFNKPTASRVDVLGHDGETQARGGIRPFC